MTWACRRAVGEKVGDIGKLDFWSFDILRPSSALEEDAAKLDRVASPIHSKYLLQTPGLAALEQRFSRVTKPKAAGMPGTPKS